MQQLKTTFIQLTQRFRLQPQWQEGRQTSGYRKLKLFALDHCDAYVLHYPVGSSIPKHVDPVTDRRHYRFNVELIKAKIGGQLICEQPIFRMGRATLFRSDISPHAVQEIIAGNRWVLSFGVALRTKKAG